MKRAFLCISILFLFQSCWIYDDEGERNFEIQYRPITQSRVDFENAIVLIEDREVVNSGKIYVKDNIIYLNERNEGFHIFDNSDTENPRPIAFLKVPLATDLAIRGNIIYVHHAVDLVAFTYSKVGNAITILHRERNVFPELISPEGLTPADYGVAEDFIVLGYELIN